MKPSKPLYDYGGNQGRETTDTSLLEQAFWEPLSPEDSRFYNWTMAVLFIAVGAVVAYIYFRA